MLAPISNIALNQQFYPEVPFPIQTHPGTVDQYKYTNYKERDNILNLQVKEVEDYMDVVIKNADKLDDFTKPMISKSLGYYLGNK